MRIKRADANQPEIVEALRDIGVSVTHIHTVGNGVPDLLCSYKGKWLVLEVKDGSKPPSARRLTPDESVWAAEQKAPVYIVTSAHEAISVVKSN
jgi:hypothetical protein